MEDDWLSKLTQDKGTANAQAPLEPGGICPPKSLTKAIVTSLRHKPVEGFFICGTAFDIGSKGIKWKKTQSKRSHRSTKKSAPQLTLQPRHSTATASPRRFVSGHAGKTAQFARFAFMDALLGA